MLRRQCRSRNHTSFWLYWECYSCPSTCVRNRWVSGRSKGKCRHRNDFRFVYKPNDAVQTVDLLVGVARRWFLGYKRCRDQTFGWVCHVCYQTSDWIAVDRSDGRRDWIRYKQVQEIKIVLCEGFWTLLLLLKNFLLCLFLSWNTKTIKKTKLFTLPWHSEFKYNSSLLPVLVFFLGSGRLRDSMKTCCPFVFTIWTSLQICWNVI